MADCTNSELQSDFLPTLLSEYALWTPLDIVNFWKVLVHLQVSVQPVLRGASKRHMLHVNASMRARRRGVQD